MTNQEKQRVKRKERRQTIHKQTLQVKVKKHKIARKQLINTAYKEGQLLILKKASLWLQYEFPKKGKKLFEQFLDYINLNK